MSYLNRIFFAGLKSIAREAEKVFDEFEKELTKPIEDEKEQKNVIDIEFVSKENKRK